MSENTATTDEIAANEAAERARAAMQAHNEDLRRDKLRRQVQRAHEWRVQVWAQSEFKIRAAQEGLKVLGADPIELFTPQFDDDQMLQHYSTMPLSK